jgi:ABC-2 type transport system permease protein
MLASLGPELLKIRKRPSTWVLALICLAIIVLLNYTLTYALLSRAPPPSFPEGTPEKAAGATTAAGAVPGAAAPVPLPREPGFEPDSRLP